MTHKEAKTLKSPIFNKIWHNPHVRGKEPESETSFFADLIILGDKLFEIVAKLSHKWTHKT